MRNSRLINSLKTIIKLLAIIIYGSSSAPAVAAVPPANDNFASAVQSLKEFKLKNICQFTFQNKHRTVLFLLIFLLASIIVCAQSREPEITAEARKFIAQGDHTVALEAADLNGDGTPDFILVTEKINVESVDDERLLTVITRGANGKLKLAARNEKVVYCRLCDGVGNLSLNIEIRENGFTVNNYSGKSNWGDRYRFDYSCRARTWRLVEI